MHMRSCKLVLGGLERQDGVKEANNAEVFGECDFNSKQSKNFVL